MRHDLFSFNLTAAVSGRSMQTIINTSNQVPRNRRGHLNTPVAIKKKTPVMTACEVNARGRWLPCTIYKALTERGQLMR